MVQRSQDWEWSSLKPTVRSGPDRLLCYGPTLKLLSGLAMSTQWNANGVKGEGEGELKAPRHSLARGTPFGDTHWQTKTAAMLGLESSLRPRWKTENKRNIECPC